MHWELVESPDVVYWRMIGWEESGAVRARFFSRRGGVSRPPFQELNFGFTVGDRPEDVLANRERAARSFGIGIDRWVFCRQVHGRRVHLAGLADAGRGARSVEDALPDTDAVVTRESGLVLATLAADCVPVLLYAPEARAVGAVHAGWRGTALQAAAAAVEALSSLGARAREILAVIGPAIGPCCYEVDEKVRSAFVSEWGRVPERLFAPSREGRYLLDLWEANREVLRRAGLDERRITVMGVCTSCREDLCFSHRRDRGVTGRMAAAIALL
ncbi:MAG: peptidoglycan editing factor PgeF [Alicyclobacillaceae bacterium]|nr:peptidoglycan editing factor PgeF [Alicyclobacillaceae bacterium]